MENEPMSGNEAKVVVVNTISNISVIMALRNSEVNHFVSVEEIAEATGLNNKSVVAVLKVLRSPNRHCDWRYVRPNATNFEEAPKITLTADGRAMADTLAILSEISAEEEA